MTRKLLVWAVISTALRGTAHAQFDNLVTTDDGSTLLFQSQWRLAGSSDANSVKVFHWNSSGFTRLDSPLNPGFVIPASASNPVISGDGGITAYVTFPGCASPSCNAGYTPVVSGATLPPSLPPSAVVQISRNGRYIAANTKVLDRDTGAIQMIESGDPTGGPLPVGGRFGISDRGGLLYLVLHRIFILSTVDLVLSSQPDVKIASSPVIYAAVVSAVENRVVYETSNGTTHRQLWSFDLASRVATMLEDRDFGTYFGVSQFQPAMSNDGTRLVYRRINAATQAWEAVLQDYATGSTAVLGTMLPSTNNFTITGDGTAVWLHRADGRLVRIAIDSGVATETTGRHAWMAQREGGAVYGSYNHLFGGGFSMDGESALPTDLSVDLSGLRCPILTATPQQLGVQIPWEAYPANYNMTLRNSSSPFESVLQVNVVDLSPTFERGGSPNDANRFPAVAHQDFHGPVTFSDPAVPGETVHLYMTGLGSVLPQPGNGQAPESLTYTSQRPFCSVVSPYLDTQTGAAVLYSGMAPGMVGIYQVDVTIPSGFPAGVATMECVDRGNSQGLLGDYGTIVVGK